MKKGEKHELLEQGIIGIKEEALEKYMLNVESKDNVIIDKLVTEIQAMLAYFSQS